MTHSQPALKLTAHTVSCCVSRIERFSHDVLGLWLRLPEVGCLPFIAGQYVEIIMQDGCHRAFSIANAPHEDEYLQLHVRHYDGGAFSNFARNQLQENELMNIRGPFGCFYLREASDRPIIFVAGGTGFAPVKGIIEYALVSGITRSMHLYWGVRASRDLYLPDLPRRWTEENRHVRYIPVLSEPSPTWTGRVGLVHEAVLEDFDDLSEHEVYASGPPAMVHAIRDEFVRYGLKPDHLFSDALESENGS